jgi:uncharacterized protein
MRSALTCVLVVLCLAVSACAQDTKPSRDEIVTLLNLLDTKENIRVALQQQTAQMKIGMRQGFLAKQPKASEAVLKKLEGLLDGAFAEFSVDELFDATVPVYQNNLTTAEVKAMTDFYSSVAGRQILKKMPKIITESMAAGGMVAQAKMAKIMQRMDQQMEELMKLAAEEGESTEQRQ